MATKLIKKQLGDILYNNLYVPRITKGCIVPATSRNKQLYRNIKGIEYGSRSNGRKIIKVPNHVSRYQSDTKSHHKGDARMKHPTNMKEINYWYTGYSQRDGKRFSGKEALNLYAKSLEADLTSPKSNVKLANAIHESDNSNDTEDADNENEDNDKSHVE